MKKILLFALCCLTTAHAFAINPLRNLRKLNKAAFNTPLDAALTRQTFAQLRASQQLAQFSQAERNLLLAHKFTQEFDRWPRTVIFRNGKLVDPAQYTTAELQETQLGRSLRNTLEKDPPAPPLIRQELEHLKLAYAPHSKNIFVLEKLNAWLITHPWPRETIPHEGRPLTAEEEYEISLATDANKILTTRLNAIPPELVEQLRSIRQLTDWDYYPTAQDKQQAGYTHVLNQVYAWLNKYHTWPRLTPDVSSEEWALANNIAAILPAHKLSQNPILMELSTLKNIYQPLTEWTSTIDTPVPTRPKYDFYTPESELGRTRPIEATGGFANPNTALPSFLLEEENRTILLKLIDWLKQHRTWPHLHSVTGNPQEIQLAKNLYEFIGPHSSELRDLRNQWQQKVPSIELAKATPAAELYDELYRWTACHNRWPNEAKIKYMGTAPIRVPEEAYTPEDIAETDLAKRVAAFVTYADEFEPGQWKKEPFGKWWALLQFPSKFNNPELEQFRLLYRQYNED